MEFLGRENKVGQLQLDKEYTLAKAQEDALQEILNEEYRFEQLLERD